MQSHRTLFGYNLSSNSFEGFIQTVYADNNTPNTTGDCVKKTLEVKKGSRKSLKHTVS